jgi:hypothetical protein
VNQAERLDVVAGDLGDTYVLSQILHGWPDDGAAQILERCVLAGADDVRILLVEGLLSESPTADEASFDLFMLALTGGRQRTLEDFRRLAESVGLSLRSSQRLATGNSLVELGI